MAWDALHLHPLGLVVLSAAAVYVAVILSCRLNGLRSFATMSAFDFAMTVAIGSLMATTILSSDVPILHGLVGVASLFLFQRLVAGARRWPYLDRLIDNQPRLLVRDGVVHEANLRRCHMTREDLHSKIRGAGVPRLEDVALMVMETSGSVAVVRRDGTPLDGLLLQHVKQ